MTLAEVKYLDLDSVTSLTEIFENPKLPSENSSIRFQFYINYFLLDRKLFGFWLILYYLCRQKANC